MRNNVHSHRRRWMLLCNTGRNWYYVFRGYGWLALSPPVRLCRVLLSRRHLSDIAGSVHHVCSFIWRRRRLGCGNDCIGDDNDGRTNGRRRYSASIHNCTSDDDDDSRTNRRRRYSTSAHHRSCSSGPRVGRLCQDAVSRAQYVRRRRRVTVHVARDDGPRAACTLPRTRLLRSRGRTK